MKHLLTATLLLAPLLAIAGGEKKPLVDPPSYQPLPLRKYLNDQLHKSMVRSSVEGWTLTGTRPEAYEMACEETFSECTIPILRTRPWTAEPFGMGSLTHVENAVAWRGRRVELKASLRTGGVDGWAGLWMRIDGKDGKVLAFDNMQNRALRGTSSFHDQSVVLDVPEEAERITFGVLLHGPGAVFIREIAFDEVDPEKSKVTDLVAPLRAQGNISAGK